LHYFENNISINIKEILTSQVPLNY